MNWDGRLGDGTTATKILPVQVGKENQWVMVDAGYGHSMALKSDGSLWVWGDNAKGQLGIGVITDKYMPVRVGMDFEWQAINAGYQYNVVTKNDGSLWAWGANYIGQLGIGTNDEILKPSIVTVARTSSGY
jgi:alpha-tubulin suppressor-like RCC1 family protein